MATNARDLTSDFVVLELKRRKFPFFRLNTERLSEARVSFRPQLGEQGWIIEYAPGKVLRLVDATAGYLRRPEIPVVRSSVSDDVDREYCRNEWSIALVSALRSLGSKWLNSPVSMMLAENKPRQLATASDLGFAVPETVITNDPKVVREFMAEHVCIAKPLSSSLFGQGEKERVIFTNRLAPSDADNDTGIEVAPIILQREVVKQSDLRVTVVGKRVFAAEIHSQISSETEVDWRRGSRTDLAHVEHRLPDSIVQKCIQLTSRFGLRFSAIDLVLGRNGNYYFLEINPNGQWAWIEKRIGARISEAIVDELEGIANAQPNS